MTREGAPLPPSAARRSPFRGRLHGRDGACQDTLSIMRALIVSTSERVGGAAVAAGRLMGALASSGVGVRMLVRDRQSKDGRVLEVDGGPFRMRHFLLERLGVFCLLGLRRKRLFEVDIANTGFDITGLDAFREADVVHIHWVNQGMLSLRGLGKVLSSGKPVVWTMHDMWPFTGVCHYALGCGKYLSGCSRCPLLPSGGPFGDASRRVWEAKRALYGGTNRIRFVACSEWLASEAGRSALLSGQDVTAIPNPIDTSVFSPGDRKAARAALGLPPDMNVILFAAQRATNPIKGMPHLVEACRRMAGSHPETLGTTAVAILGGRGSELSGNFPYPAFPLGYVGDTARVVEAYRAADAFVVPSLMDNLPNTVMEALACGLPCVGFDVGGIPEMIDHRRNGYVAARGDAGDLAEGIHWTLFIADRAALRREAVAKVESSYSGASVAGRYAAVYERAMGAAGRARP